MYTSHRTGSFVALIIIRRCDPPSLATPTDKHIYESQPASAIAPVTDVLNRYLAVSPNCHSTSTFLRRNPDFPRLFAQFVLTVRCPFVFGNCIEAEDPTTTLSRNGARLPTLLDRQRAFCILGRLPTRRKARCENGRWRCKVEKGGWTGWEPLGRVGTRV